MIVFVSRKYEQCNISCKGRENNNSRVCSTNEELTSIGVGTGIGHGQGASATYNIIRHNNNNELC